MDNFQAYLDRENRLEAQWYAEQLLTHLRVLKAGAWHANDVDGYARASAEIRRRERGGTFAENYRRGWAQDDAA